MEIITLYFFGWTIIVIVIFIFVPSNKIRVIGRFFRDVLPRLPIAEIIRFLKK